MVELNIKAETILAQRFQIGTLIGKGSFGKVYFAIDLQSNKEVAVKIETKKSKHSQLSNESTILQELQGIVGIPRYVFSSDQGEYNILVMELLGESIRSKFSKCNKIFSLKTTLLISEQMLDRIKSLHDHGYIHRDIKPQQFVTPYCDKENLIYLIDYGLSKKYINKLGFHIPYTENCPFAGTYYYASINCHTGIQQGRRDDLESMLYSIAFLLRGDLPWIPNSKQKFSAARIHVIKLKTSPLKLMKDAPYDFSELLCYVKSLQYDTRPDYDYIKGILSELKRKVNVNDNIFDWNILIEVNNNRRLYKQNKKKKQSKERDESVAISKTSISFYEQVVLESSEDSKTIEQSKFPEFHNRNILPQKPIQGIIESITLPLTLQYSDKNEQSVDESHYERRPRTHSFDINMLESRIQQKSNCIIF
ncbi:unnamed protein product [Blepharisma stoltei]|uniref:Casein kinase I n=1 Tax=Blepharisma stoltei TaxID=1481888 RepID=A0AAU9IX47_9CILI|nr:unnamed protein product [Blepharisma stoltei]